MLIHDNFRPHLHGQNKDLPENLLRLVELYRGDVRDVNLSASALERSQVLLPLAANAGYRPLDVSTSPQHRRKHRSHIAFLRATMKI